MLKALASISLVVLVGASYAENGLKRISTAGPWVIYKQVEGSCMAEAPAYPPKTGRIDVLALISLKNEPYLALTDPHFNFPTGSFPIGMQHNGIPGFRGTVMGVVMPGMTKAILVKLTKDQLIGVGSAANITLTLGTHEHYFSTNSGNTLLRAIAVCEQVGADPFASDPVR